MAFFTPSQIVLSLLQSATLNEETTSNQNWSKLFLLEFTSDLFSLAAKPDCHGLDISVITFLAVTHVVPTK